MKNDLKIEELRRLCQASKIEKEPFVVAVLRKISIYFTKLFLFTPITSSQVTFLSCVVAIFAGLFLSFGNSWGYLAGALLYGFFFVLDCVDGEIARYRNTMGMEGDYFDFFAHFVTGASLYGFLSFGIYKNIGSVAVFAFGFIALSANLIDKVRLLLVYYSICMKSKGFFKLKNGIIQSDESTIFENSFKGNEKTLFFRLSKLIAVNFSDIHVFANLLIMAIINLLFSPLKVFGVNMDYVTMFFFFYAICHPIIVTLNVTKVLTSGELDKRYQEFFGGS